MDKIRNFLIWSGIIALVLFIIMLVVGFKIASTLLVVAFYIVAFIFVVALCFYLYRKAKEKLGGSDRDYRK
ncbi:MAG: hypothetical protein LUF87_05655 [Alistipes sp.]|nr:hypothetical protein [Alistipes sp.]